MEMGWKVKYVFIFQELRMYEAGDNIQKWKKKNL